MRRRRRRDAFIAAAALAAIGGSAFFTLSDVDLTGEAPEPNRSYTPPRPPGWVDVADRPGDAQGLLTIQAAGPDGRATAFLGKALGPEDLAGVVSSDQSLLHRELVRQAILIAARDGRGLATRDELLDEEAPPAGGPPLAIRFLFDRTFGDSRLIARQLDGKSPPGTIKPLLAKYLGLDPKSDDFPLKLAALMERFSRDEFPALLDRPGGGGGPNRSVESGPAPEGVEARLSALGLVDQFEAARALHRSIRTDGESPERLGAMARAYAQLAASTAHHWSPVHRAFQARALLYAERLVARAPESASSLRHRAFARALVGFHAAALKDLEDAASLDAKAEKPAPPPGWVDVIDAHLKYDRARLEAAKPPHDRLAAFLKMLNLQYPPFTRLAVGSAEAVLQLDPDCGRAFDLISDYGGLGDRHRSTVVGPEAFRVLLRKKLADAPDLPASVRAALDRDADELALTDALAEAGRPSADADEPSWGVLAQLTREARFVQVWRRLEFMSRSWGVPVGDYWEEARPLVEGHRFRPYLGSMTGDPEELRRFAEFAGSLAYPDLEPNTFDMIELVVGKGGRDPKSYWDVLGAHASKTVGDLGLSLARFSRSSGQEAETLLRVSPHDPYAKAFLVRWDWQGCQPRLEAWIRSDGDAPAFQRALGYQYMHLKRYAEAREWLGRYVRNSSDKAAYEKLAECYEAEGDREGWLKTLESYLEGTEDAGLSHAQVRVKIANYYVSQGLPEKAKPYADEAARTWAAWAMLCAADVDELVGDWEGAEAWNANAAERYPNLWHSWYRYCRRTGRGDLESARALARAVVRRPEGLDGVSVAFFHWIEGDVDKAGRTMQAILDAEGGTYIAALLALLHDQAGAAEKRDALAGRIATEPALRDGGPQIAAVSGLLLGSLAPGAPPLDAAALDAAIEATPGEGRENAQFLAARFLLNRGRPDEARKYLESVLGSRRAFDWARAASGAWLHEAFPETRPAEDDPDPKPDETPRPGPTRA